MNETLGHSETEENDGVPHVILFLAVSFAVGVAVRGLIKHISWFKLPYTVVLLLLGILFGVVTSNVIGLRVYTVLASASPHLILHTFLPVLVFESAFAMDSHTFLHSIGSILLLAVFGMCLASLLCAIVVTYVLNYGWSFAEGLLFGAVVDATDPVAVVALLRELGTSKQLSILIEGESLMNDGSAIVLFSIMLEICKGSDNISVQYVILKFVRVSIGGPLFGIACGHIVIFWLTRILNDAVSEITLTVVAAYFTFFVGETLLGVSGVLAVLSLGVFINSKKTSISPEVENSLTMFWQMLSYLSNTIIFILVGIVIMERAVVVFKQRDVVDAIVLYMAANVIRAFMVAVMYPILQRLGYGISWRSAVVLVWSGLRGAVSLSLALIVFQDPVFNSSHSDSDDSSSQQPLAEKYIGQKTLIHTAALVFATLIINGTTMKPLLRVLGMSDVGTANRANMTHAIHRLRETRQRSISILKMDRFLADSDWATVNRMTAIRDPYMTNDSIQILPNNVVGDLSAFAGGGRSAACPNCSTTVYTSPTAREFLDMVEDARLRYINTERISYWRQFEHGMMSDQAVRTLVESADTAADKPNTFISVGELKKYWQVRGLSAWIRRQVMNIMSIEEALRYKYSLPKSRFRQAIYSRIVSRTWFDVLIYTVITINMLLMLLELLTSYGVRVEVPAESFHSTKINDSSKATTEEERYNQSEINIEIIRFSINVFFFLFYLCEAIIKVLGIGVKNYWSSHWNKLDLMVVLLSIADVGYELFDLVSKQGSSETIKYLSPAILRNVRFLRLFRIARVFRLIKPILPKLLSFLNQQINQRLLLGYDIGKGYVVGEEEVSKYLEHMVDHKQILYSLKQVSEDSRLSVVKDLALLQREHPGIAVAVKTRHAIRSILNNCRQSVQDLKEGGLLNESEHSKLESMMEDLVKKLMLAPSYIDPPEPEIILENVTWFGRNPEMVSRLKEHAQLISLAFGDELMSQGEPPDGVHVIVSGTVRVECRNVDQLMKEIEEFGIIPNYELLHQAEDVVGATVHDFLSTGTVLGEIGVLTGRPRDASVICETDVQAYFLPIDILHDLFDNTVSSTTLEYTMWRRVSIRLVTTVLIQQPQYQAWPQDQLRLHAERCFLPVLTEKTTFTISDVMDDVILVQGKATNSHTKEEFIAPAYIPRSANQLTFSSAQTDRQYLPRLAIIAGNEMAEQELHELTGCPVVILDTEERRQSQPGNVNFASSRYRKRRASRTLFNVESTSR